MSGGKAAYKAHPGRLSSTPQALVILVKIFLVLLILLMLPKLVTGSKRQTASEIRYWRNHCREHVCDYSIPEESLNCVNMCVSPGCYDQVYADMPLEDGEVDLKRARLYEACLRDELNRASRAKRKAVLEAL